MLSFCKIYVKICVSIDRKILLIYLVKQKTRAIDILFFYTDGVTEASKSKNKYDLYGIDRLKKVLYDNRNDKIEKIMESIEKDFYEYLSYMAPDDDFTIAAFKLK